MKRYVKVNGKWVDTDNEREAGFFYFIRNGYVYYESDEFLYDVLIGELEGESDTLEDVKDAL